MNNAAYYALVQGRFYEGDVEGERYHWRKGIPGSKQLWDDLSTGKQVHFIYYRTWVSALKRGKYFYGYGTFDNMDMTKQELDDGTVNLFAGIVQYRRFHIPVTVSESLRKKVWPGANRKAGIKKVSRGVWQQLIGPGESPQNLYGLTAMLTERDLEDLLNEKIIPSDIKDSEANAAVKRAVATEVFKRSQWEIRKSKLRYNGLCQISGELLESSKRYAVDVTEAHHINFLSEGGRDADPKNLIIVSPEWHRLLHKMPHYFDRVHLAFIFAKGKALQIKEPGHLAES